MLNHHERELQAINTLRFLAADMVQKANSGHPGLPMGAATMAYVLWTRHLKFDPRHPRWINRDRFVLSGGHGSALLYSLLHLCGYDLTMDELQNFRQWESLTPGHPEYGFTPGVEVTTGPLGQGFANGVGMAIASKHLGALFNRPEFPIFDHYVYGIVTDGDLMEGVASEAASLAGHLSLGKLIYLYDDNHVSIDGNTELSFTEDRLARFRAYRWHVQQVEDGNDIDAIDAAIWAAKTDPRPSFISVSTVIGFGLPTRAGTSKAHGEPPGDAELDGAKQSLGWPLEPSFYIPEEAWEIYHQTGERGEQANTDWDTLLDSYRMTYPDLAADLDRRLAGSLPIGWDTDLPVFATDTKGIATRVASGKVINALAKSIPELVGGSADLEPSNKTWIDESPSFQAQTPEGRNFHFGVREHAMGSIVNGMSVYGGLIPYGATFLIFSDYMRPAIRLSSLSHYPSIWIFTHDSVGLGEDGPTHQPVEHLASLRAIPELVVIRPADANETVEAWKKAIERREGPTVLALSRQNLPTIDREIYSPANGLRQGAYILADIGDDTPELILMASGSEVQLIISAGTRLAVEGINVRIVSFPSWELFENQSAAYQAQVFPAEIKARLAVEAGVAMGWERWVGDQGEIISIEKFGASAPYQKIFQEYGITVERIMQNGSKLVNR